MCEETGHGKCGKCGSFRRLVGFICAICLSVQVGVSSFGGIAQQDRAANDFSKAADYIMGGTDGLSMMTGFHVIDFTGIYQIHHPETPPGPEYNQGPPQE